MRTEARYICYFDQEGEALPSRLSYHAELYPFTHSVVETVGVQKHQYVFNEAEGSS